MGTKPFTGELKDDLWLTQMMQPLLNADEYIDLTKVPGINTKRAHI